MKINHQNIALVQHGLIGAVIGILILHPLTKVVYWFEFKHSLLVETDNLWAFLGHRFEAAFSLEMLPMTLAFA